MGHLHTLTSFCVCPIREGIVLHVLNPLFCVCSYIVLMMMIISVVDAKCDYPSACNAMETLLLHKSHIKSGLFDDICDELKSRKVQIALLYYPFSTSFPFFFFFLSFSVLSSFLLFFFFYLFSSPSSSSSVSSSSCRKR